MGFENNGERYVLDSAIELPNASSFLWNPSMLVQVNCRGYVSSQFLQPEPSKYVTGPALEATTFMQPEQPYYAHHPGRFFYIKDEISGEIFSAPYEPVRSELDYFRFIVEPDAIRWHIGFIEIDVELTLTLDANDPAECWSIKICNNSAHERRISVYPYFPFGYRSWMNQSAVYDPELNAVISRAITPYQKVEQYFENKQLNEWTYLLSQCPPDAWETRQRVFEGEGGLHAPSAMKQIALDNGSANYQNAAAIMQYRLCLTEGESRTLNFIFGPAKDTAQIHQIKQRFFSDATATEAASGLDVSRAQYANYMNKCQGFLQIETPNDELNHYVNTWLPRQLFYHGDVNRLTTDPQTRNYIQDAMGIGYLAPSKCRQAFINALSQQHRSGEMPDGVLLHEHAKLKYINQVPHTDHCVWLPICLIAYLDETDDYEILDVTLAFQDSVESCSVFTHIELAMNWLKSAVDHRGLSLINQGDWCDPMNMVGYQGKGVSAWLTMACAYAFKTWSQICERFGDIERSHHWLKTQAQFNQRINQYFYHDKWYARGITDQGRVFGTDKDPEGKIFLNAQSWSMLCEAANSQSVDGLIEMVEQHLMTPFGPTMLAPSYTQMVEDIGRVTQKFPGTAENGSVYNHAACFYAFALFEQHKTDQAIGLLINMLPQPEDMKRRGQLPTFIPNYYRGAYHQLPDEAGKSSQLFNTGTIAWYYRCIIEGIAGLRGCREGLHIAPQLPRFWPKFTVHRRFRGADFYLQVTRVSQQQKSAVYVDDTLLEGNVFADIEPGRHYQINVQVAHD